MTRNVRRCVRVLAILGSLSATYSASAQCLCDGDVDPPGGNGFVNTDDITRELSCLCLPPVGVCASADVDCNGVIDWADMDMVLSQFVGGAPGCTVCPSTTCCSDGNVCTYDECVLVGGVVSCAHEATKYGDVNGDCVLNLDDILLVLNRFSGGGTVCPSADIFPLCGGNGGVNLDDILSILAAFSGFDPCAAGGVCDEMVCCCPGGC